MFIFYSVHTKAFKNIGIDLVNTFGDFETIVKCINGDKINDLDFIINKDVAIGSKYVVVRRGKKKYFIVCFGGNDEKE